MLYFWKRLEEMKLLKGIMKTDMVPLFSHLNRAFRCPAKWFPGVDLRYRLEFAFPSSQNPTITFRLTFSTVGIFANPVRTMFWLENTERLRPREIPVSLSSSPVFVSYSDGEGEGGGDHAPGQLFPTKPRPRRRNCTS